MNINMPLDINENACNASDDYIVAIKFNDLFARAVETHATQKAAWKARDIMNKQNKLMKRKGEFVV